mgnify:CR=1 FL=1
MARKIKFEIAKFDKITPGGQALGTLENGKKIFAWGVLPSETAKIQITKNKSSFMEGFAVEIIEKSPKRVEPRDPESFLSTSPWQIFNFDFEQNTKQELIRESFRQENIDLPQQESFFSNDIIFEYRNKVEFSFWWEKSEENSGNGELNLAFFKRGGKGKVPVFGTSLATPEINQAGQKVLEILRARQTPNRDLKTLLIRTNQKGEISAQLYVKNEDFKLFNDEELHSLGFKNFELIFSNPKSPASVITKKLQALNEEKLSDQILGINFNYATESFFQINLPVYEQALRDMEQFIDPHKPTLDLYAGVGSIGLTIGKQDLTLVEINEGAVAEMKRNINELHIDNSAKAILAPSEKVLDFIKKDSNLIVDPPRAGMDKKVCEKILEIEPQKVIYLSCNPTTQARDAAILSEKYKIIYTRGYNFFPRTPHIENLIILEVKNI